MRTYCAAGFPSTRDPEGTADKTLPSDCLDQVKICGPSISLAPFLPPAVCHKLLLAGFSERFKDEAALVSRSELSVGCDSGLW
jgi:hypothetical protein